ncbi:MAG: hypothetical protein M0026_09765 [Nocardiopsaceae bacterium]|nr:hypothetical protein [Nocardiopsaceae bacterium]
MAWARLLGRAPINRVYYHAVPALFGRNRRGADAFANAWSR